MRRRERTEVYDYVPARLVARGMDRPPNPVAHVLHEHFGRHLPLHRIDVELRRLGGDVREVTRDRWWQGSAR